MMVFYCASFLSAGFLIWKFQHRLRWDWECEEWDFQPMRTCGYPSARSSRRFLLTSHPSGRIWAAKREEARENRRENWCTHWPRQISDRCHSGSRLNLAGFSDLGFCSRTFSDASSLPSFVKEVGELNLGPTPQGRADSTKVHQWHATVVVSAGNYPGAKSQHKTFFGLVFFFCWLLLAVPCQNRALFWADSAGSS